MRPRFIRHQYVDIQRERCPRKRVPRRDIHELRLQQRANRVVIDSFERTARAPPIVLQRAHRANETAPSRVLNLTAEQSPREQLARGGLQRGRDFPVEAFDAALEFEAEILEPA